jgi:hypothetical protein
MGDRPRRWKTRPSGGGPQVLSGPLLIGVGSGVKGPCEGEAANLGVFLTSNGLREARCDRAGRTVARDDSDERVGKGMRLGHKSYAEREGGRELVSLARQLHHDPHLHIVV